MMEAQPFPLVRRPRRWPWFILAFALGGTLIAGSLWLAAGRPASNDPTEVTFVIEAGEGFAAISQRLQQAGLIRHVRLFQFYALASGSDSRLQVGSYRLPKNLTMGELLRRLTGSQRKPEVTVTTLEGWSNRELAAYLEQAGVLAPEEFFRLVQRKAEWWGEYEFLSSRPPERDLEGYLFPDTYRIFAGASGEDIIRKMLENFGRKLTPELRSEIARQGKTIHEVLTLASIIEREVPDGPDRPNVAGIFLQRLTIGMPLQSDATVNYVTGKKAPRPSAGDLQAESEYNTYIHRGLPPGPINNPGVSAIRAALYPQASPYLYYLTTPDGTVIYSRTFEEHVAAKARYYR